MAYVPIPKDLSKVKTKVLFNLTKRQLICFTLAALVQGHYAPLFRRSDRAPKPRQGDYRGGNASAEAPLIP